MLYTEPILKHIPVHHHTNVIDNYMGDIKENFVTLVENSQHTIVNLLYVLCFYNFYYSLFHCSLEWV